MTERNQPTGGTPEGHTPEKPAADEYGEPGTPAAGLSPATPHAADAEETRDDAHAMDAHHVGGGHEEDLAAGHDHEDALEEAALGPIDWRAWGYGVAGVAIAVLIAGLFYFATLPK